MQLSPKAPLLGLDGPLDSRAGACPPMAAAVALGVLTSIMGTVYARALKGAVTATWRTLPGLLPTANPSLIVPAICTMGGALIGVLASNLPSVTMPDFIGSQTSTTTSLPGVWPFLPRVLLLSLLTSTFGFSVGPEAPMVLAGGLVGSSFSKRLYGESDHAMARTMAFVGAAGALTTFIGMPLAGAIFVLEITRPAAGLTAGAYDALAPAVAASVASLLTAKALLAPLKPIGGHFVYAPMPIGDALTGRAMAAVGLSAGVGGALIGHVFRLLVQTYKRPMWPQAPEDETCETARRWPHIRCGPRMRHTLVKSSVGLAVGWAASCVGAPRSLDTQTAHKFRTAQLPTPPLLLTRLAPRHAVCRAATNSLVGVLFPQTLFWGEGSLQHMLDGQATPLAAVWPWAGLQGALSPEAMARFALVDPTRPFASPVDALKVGAAKLVAIALACAGGFPGGIIFPLFFCAAAFAHGAAGVLVPAALVPCWVMCLMAATQASVTRTPLATVFMLGLSATASAQLSVLLPPVIVASYVGVWAAQLLSKETFFPYEPKQ